MTQKMTREKAIALVGPLIDRIHREKWEDSLNDELVSKLTEETVAVLSPSTKLWLIIWARQTDKPTILERLQKCTEDKSTLSVRTLLDDLSEVSQHPLLDVETARREMKAAAASLRHCFQDESKARAEVIGKLYGVAKLTLAIKQEVKKARSSMTTVEAMMPALEEAIINTRASATRKKPAFREAIEPAVEEEMIKFRQIIQKGVTKRTHEEAFGNNDRN